MMKIEIVTDFQPQEFVNERMKLTKLSLRKNYRLALSMALIGVGIIIYEKLISEASYSISNDGFPIAFFLLAIFILIQVRQFTQKTKLYLTSLTRNIKGQTTTEITEEGISYADNEHTVKYNWSFFTHYRLIDNILYLTGPIEIGSGFVINMSDMEAESQDELMNFLNKHLVKRKK